MNCFAFAIGILLIFFLGIYGGLTLEAVNFAQACDKNGSYQLDYKLLKPIEYQCGRKP